MDQAKTPVDDGPKIDAATLTCTVTALVSLLLRLFVRTRLIKNIGWDVSNGSHFWSLPSTVTNQCRVGLSHGLCDGAGM